MPTEFKPGERPQTAPEGEPIVVLENVTVQYRVPKERIGTFKEYAIRALQRRLEFVNFLALKDVNLTIYRGEVLGIIGNNGAGKSTMLKVISRVLRPTKGRVALYGKIAPLLELGAGFHPELSGRENVYLNGALLGYNQAEMDEVFESIVDFAELRDFIDAPVRTYSSGMYARLGFAVATARVPEILIVDEILSVGDESFQKKSNDLMQKFQRQGATVLIVSHNLNKIQEMCQRVAWLSRGELKMIGDPAQVVQAYRESTQ
ncbi:MAG: ABC transporter ATP-binding protein [Chloroflexi bacterium]|jgi:ABC-2 type transport system ATP-binding protein|nr:ABC transporter ATP-binding protein [Anaerolineaceae bacterium]NLI45141.1 ABC transporter ATP-binding protein [Chloroflexota bacterium]HOE34327.1 ABC transporter ATP-binding protein [Anaerolineaceae bacterium]HOT25608.1 ABC transporter ATP-binding protein [Anaerolineaceae bacterium]HQH57242.1 ABC transporter ATP-binding protein [Anaerolineaceae bacterium]